MERSPVISWLFHMRVLCKLFSNIIELLCMVNLTLGTIFIYLLNMEVHNVWHVYFVCHKQLICPLNMEYTEKRSLPYH
jgi:hypothetical protein